MNTFKGHVWFKNIKYLYVGVWINLFHDGPNTFDMDLWKDVIIEPLVSRV